MSRRLVATAVIGGFLVLAQPAAAQSWSERFLATVSAWTPWTSTAAAPTETPPASETAGMLGWTIATAKAYVPAFATGVASHASDLFDRGIFLAKSYGPGFQTQDPDASQDEGWSDSVKQSMGCLIGGTTGTALAVLAGGENLVNVIAGGIVPAANPLALYVGVVGVVFASFCAVGQALTPLYYEYFTPAPLAGNAPLKPFPSRPGNLPDARAFHYIAYP